MKSWVKILPAMLVTGPQTKAWWAQQWETYDLLRKGLRAMPSVSVNMSISLSMLPSGKHSQFATLTMVI
jgi:hypothetical protein